MTRSAHRRAGIQDLLFCVLHTDMTLWSEMTRSSSSLTVHSAPTHKLLQFGWLITIQSVSQTRSLLESRPLIIPVRKVPTWLAPWKRKGIEIGREIESFGDVPANWFKERLVGDADIAMLSLRLIE